MPTANFTKQLSEAHSGQADRDCFVVGGAAPVGCEEDEGGTDHFTQTHNFLIISSTLYFH